MPTYEYACTVCDDQIEVVQRFTDPALTECPACGGALRKVFSPVGVVFKGSGFYKTDSRRSSSSSTAPAKKADSTPAATESSSSSGTSGGTSSGGSSSGGTSSGGTSSTGPTAATA